MRSEKIYLWEDNKEVTLTSYILDNSEEIKIKIKKRPAVIICPGGGYLGTSDREAEPVAMRFATEGYNAFVLRYTTGFNSGTVDFNNLSEINKSARHPQPLFDLGKAIMLVKENENNWNIDKNNIIVCGFSAGGHLAATLATKWNCDLLKDKFNVESEVFRPRAVILSYPVIDYIYMREEVISRCNKDFEEFWRISNSVIFGETNPSEERLKELSPSYNVTKNTVPAFIWHTANDGFVGVDNSLNFAKQLSKNNIPYDLHIFQEGPHGLALCNETTAMEECHINRECQVWFDLAMNWLRLD